VKILILISRELGVDDAGFKAKNKMLTQQCNRKPSLVDLNRKPILFPDHILMRVKEGLIFIIILKKNHKKYFILPDHRAFKIIISDYRSLKTSSRSSVS
jgi:hypothetical protein